MLCGQAPLLDAGRAMQTQRRWRLIAAALMGLAIGCASATEDLDADEQCVPVLSYREKKKRCDQQFAICLDSPIQSIRTARFGHNQ
jgi:hypothetical protein